MIPPTTTTATTISNGVKNPAPIFTIDQCLFTVEQCPECLSYKGASLLWCLGGSNVVSANKWRRGQKLRPLPNTQRKNILVGSNATSEPPLPSLSTRALNFGAAVVNHVRTGRNKATEDQIAVRLAICQTCPLFRASDQKCSACGCSCSGGGKVLSKLAWAESVCPHPAGPKWGAVTASEEQNPVNSVSI